MNLKTLDNFKRFLEKILSSDYFIGAIFTIATILIICHPIYELSEILSYADRGKMLLHGIKSEAISYSMPLISLLGAVTEYHLNINPQISLKIAFILAIIGTYLLSYMIGLSAQGRITAFATLLIAGMYDADFEQALYSFFLVLAAVMLLQRNKIYNVKTSIMAGLAIGFSFFVRSPLFVLPFLILIFDYFHHSKNLKKYIINSIVFLSAAYILLLPWAGVNHFLFNKFIPFEANRGAVNIITGVKGATFTMEGDARALVGLNKNESVYKWATKELLKNPRPALTAVPKRVLQVFYMHPFLLLLGLTGFILGRKNKNVLLISLIGGYFIGIHCLFPIGERYFYPLKHLLAFPAAFGLCFVFKKREKPSSSHTVVYAFFYAALAIIIMLELILFAYPFYAKKELLALNNSLQKHPHDRWLTKNKGELLLFKQNNYEEGLQLLKTAYKIKPERETDLGYILNTLEAKNLNEISNPPESFKTHELLILKMIKELQLGEMDAAKRTLLIAQTQWNKENFLRMPTYEKDFEISKGIKEYYQTSL
ncbi:MAG: hypothetical protein U9Q34_01435, partial [Elusimicrobiota bacterium]|nr:hypothetical protein [Elusimicrobiota bacterium]